MNTILEQARSLIAIPPTRRLVAVGAIALAASTAFYLFSLGVIAGSMPVTPPARQIVLAAILAGLTAYCSLRIRSAAGFTFCMAMLISIIGLSFATEAGYGVHFIGRNAPLIDPILARIDQAMGYDSRQLLRWVDRHPAIALWLRTSYVDCGYQLLPAIPLLIALRQNERLLVFAGASFLSLLAVHLCALAMPAVGAYTFYHFSPADHPHIILAASDTAADVFALRSADHLAIPTDHLMGLITFPSYHMATACLFAWLFWRTKLRVPALLFNLGVAIAALVDGCHYLTDVTAGAGLAAGCVTMINWSARRIDEGRAVGRRTDDIAYAPAAG